MLLAVALPISAVLLACDLSIWGPDDSCRAGEVNLSVDFGPPMKFRWGGDCRIVELQVFATAAPGLHWSIQKPSGLKPPATFGVLPDGATGMESPVPLVSGEEYVVYLLGNGEGETQVVAATTSFVAP